MAHVNFYIVDRGGARASVLVIWLLLWIGYSTPEFPEPIVVDDKLVY